ncbi:MAG: DUF4363 family protein [Oscillospiraceae bacterium]|nr:DUF4363 family protein [Oscillospiraceae bacterium]
MMKREFAALAVLILLIAGSILNIKRIDTLTDEIGIALCKSRTAAEQLNFKNSRELIREGLEIWQEDGTYTRIFLTQSQVDETTMAFYNLIQELNQEDLLALAPAYDELLYQLESIQSGEKPSFGSIF